MNWARTFHVAMVSIALVIVYMVVSDRGIDYVFPAAILLICAGFLSYRFKLKERLDARDAEIEADTGDESR